MNVPAESYSRIASCALLDTNYFYVYIFVLCTWYTSSFVDKDEHIKWNIFIVNGRLWIESLNWWSIIHQYLYQQNKHLPLSFVTRLTRRVPLVEQQLLALLEHLNSPPVFSEVRVTRSLVLCVCFVDRCLSSCTFSFGHCVICSSSIYGFWLHLSYFQTLLRL